MAVRPATPVASRRAGGVVAVVCILVQLLAAGLAWSANSTKCSTTDEPMHALAGWMALHRGDFRVNREDPVLWQYWIALPQGTRFVHTDGLPEHDWVDEAIRGVYSPFEWVRRTLYQTSGNDGEALVRRSKAMGLILSVSLGLLLSWWAWKLSGGAAAV